MEKEQSERIINRHYIGVVKEINGSLKYVEVDIPQDSILIEEIDAMKENENRTLMDVQQRFMEAYPIEKFEGTYYDYLYPLDYSDAYVNGVTYPRIMAYEDYKKSLAKYEKWIREEYIKNDERVKKELDTLRQESEEKYRAQVEEIVAQLIAESVSKRKELFDYKRFLYAVNYVTKLDKIVQDPNVRMFSTDQIGWKEFEYKANDDINVYIKSNFGYGNSSYFFCNLKYKDINILPYTAIIKYYYVQMIDFIRYTRRYAVNRDSWNEVFDFAVLTGNLAKHEPERFVKEWIVNEVEEMMIGIRKIMNSPKEELEKYIGFERKIDIGVYSVYRNCTTEDITEYQVLPQEKVMAFKAEKITGCLFLLDNLKSLTKIAPIIIPYIEEIESMNLQLQPEIDKHIKNIPIDLNKDFGELDIVSKDIEPLEKRIQQHYEIIGILMNEMDKLMNDDQRLLLAEKEYIRLNPDYLKIKKPYSELMAKKTKIEARILGRGKFFEILNKCKERIAKYIIAA